MTGTSPRRFSRPLDGLSAARLLLLVQGLWLPVAAGQTLRLDVGAIEGDGWRISGVVLALRPTGPQRWSLAADLARIELPAPLPPLDQISLSCPEFLLDEGSAACPRGSMHFPETWLDKQTVQVSFRYRTAPPEVAFSTERVAVAGGTARISAQLKDAAWEVDADLDGGRLDRLPAKEALENALGGLTLSGRADARVNLQGQGGLLNRAQLEVRPTDLGFAETSGLKEAQGLTGHMSAALHRDRDQWKGDLTAGFDTGLLYIDPVALDFSNRPTTMRTLWEWDPQRGRLAVEGLSLEQPGARLQGDVAISLQPRIALEGCNLRLVARDLGPLYQAVVKPWLVGTSLGDLRVAGSVEASVQQGRGGLSTVADLHRVDLDDEGGGFGIHGLEGRLAWSGSERRQSRLAWNDGNLYRVPFGSAELRIAAGGAEAELTEALEIPVLDGTLRVDALRVEGMGSGDPAWTLDAVVIPLSMERLTGLLGWPEMTGQLSAVIPDVRFAGGVLDIGGAVLVRIFDGDVVVRHLKMTRPLGPAPILEADASLRNIDLYALTRAFSFGAISGRLEGRVEGLRLEDWRPVAFDGRVATPPDDRSTHRISQRAVESLSSLGGSGVGEVMSRGMLALFKSFSYRRLGLSCRLSHGVCEMDGVKQAGNGSYYIVEGGAGLPTIDVIGYTRRVDWEVLVQRLHDATRAANEAAE